MRIEGTARSSANFFKRLSHGKVSTCILFTSIPVTILLFYGIDDKNESFFGHDYINDYRYRSQGNVVYHVGIMVSHYALLVTLSIIGLLISWIGYEMLKLSINKLSLLWITTFHKAFWNPSYCNTGQKILEINIEEM